MTRAEAVLIFMLPACHDLGASIARVPQLTCVYPTSKCVLHIACDKKVRKEMVFACIAHFVRELQVVPDES